MEGMEEIQREGKIKEEKGREGKRRQVKGDGREEKGKMG